MVTAFGLEILLPTQKTMQKAGKAVNALKCRSLIRNLTINLFFAQPVLGTPELASIKCALGWCSLTFESSTSDCNCAPLRGKMIQKNVTCKNHSCHLCGNLQEIQWETRWKIITSGGSFDQKVTTSKGKSMQKLMNKTEFQVYTQKIRFWRILKKMM